MTGRIALIQRGGCTFVEKSNNAQAAGAVALLLYNDRGGPPIQMGATSLPAAMLGQVSGQLLRDYLLTNATAQVTVASPAIRVTDINFADVVNAGSLRGPNNSFDVTKPDITGPGTNIYAAVSDAAGQFGFLTGTSMSGPHLAGAGMLIRAAHPGWTPQEVKSALQLTALLDGLQDAASFSPVPPVIIQPWTPEDSGNGRVRVNLAVNTGLVMNETFANFLAANPATGGQPRNLNLPSLRHGSCNGSCTFTRTFRNTKTTPVTWNAILSRVPAGTQVTVTPASFTFNGGLSETQTVTIQIAITQPGGLANFGYGFIGFRATAGNLPDANLSVAVRGTSDALFANGFE
jgi:subtilisin family serine protease